MSKPDAKDTGDPKDLDITLESLHEEVTELRGKIEALERHGGPGVVCFCGVPTRAWSPPVCDCATPSPVVLCQQPSTCACGTPSPVQCQVLCQVCCRCSTPSPVQCQQCQPPTCLCGTPSPVQCQMCQPVQCQPVQCQAVQCQPVQCQPVCCEPVCCEPVDGATRQLTTCNQVCPLDIIAEFVDGDGN
ncbi:MAG: hypothetical protein MI919_35510, partial [Holophagales bacterium]|nr:hypothetical protein [Holophagales bacterium]